MKKIFIVLFIIFSLIPQPVYAYLDHQDTNFLNTFISDNEVNDFVDSIPPDKMESMSEIIETTPDNLRHFYLYSQNSDSFKDIKEKYYANSIERLKIFDSNMEKMIYSFVAKYWGKKHLAIIKKDGNFPKVLSYVEKWLPFYSYIVYNHPHLRYYNEYTRVPFSKKAVEAMLVPLKEKCFLKYYLSILVIEAGFRNYKSRSGALGAFQIWQYPLNKPIPYYEKELLRKCGVYNTDKWTLDLDHQIYWSLYKTARPVGFLYDTPLAVVKDKLNRAWLSDFKKLIDKSLDNQPLLDDEKSQFHKYYNPDPRKRPLGLYDYLMAGYNGGPGSILKKMHAQTIRYVTQCGKIFSSLDTYEQLYINNLDTPEKTDMAVILSTRNDPELAGLFYPIYKDFLDFSNVNSRNYLMKGSTLY